MENFNQGHRARMRNRMITEGLNNFQDHEVLELLLYQYIPRRDTNKIAHELLYKFGSFCNIFDAEPQQLMTVKGISESTACNLALLKDVWKRYKISAARKSPLSKFSSIVEYAQDVIEYSSVEKLVVVFVDNSTNFLTSEEFSSGSIQEVHLNLKDIVAAAMRANAAGAIVFHCHVKGDCHPSDEDFIFTERVYFTFANMNVMLLDHLIFNSTENYYSFYQSGVIFQIAERYKAAFVKHPEDEQIENPQTQENQ